MPSTRNGAKRRAPRDDGEDDDNEVKGRKIAKTSKETTAKAKKKKRTRQIVRKGVVNYEIRDRPKQSFDFNPITVSRTGPIRQMLRKKIAPSGNPTFEAGKIIPYSIVVANNTFVRYAFSALALATDLITVFLLLQGSSGWCFGR
jgi:hypothetical protein